VSNLTWEQYERRFRAAALRAPSQRHFDPEYADRCLAYGKALFERNLPIIYDQYHLASLVGYDLTYLLGVSNSPGRFYRSYSIPKVSGGTRTITEPLPSLKEIQRWILENLLRDLPIHPFAKGFIPKRSIRDNARFHVGRLQVLTVDIFDFFGNVRTPTVRKIFLSLGYTPRVAILLAALCTLNGALPQGAPTSPALSNLASHNIDRRLAAYARAARIRYTRYADDLTFSGTFAAGELISFVSVVLRDNGFALNESKTRLMQRHQRQETTGIVVNEKLQVPREVRRQIRQECYYVKKFGLDSHLQRSRKTRANYLRHLLGIVGFTLFVNPADRDAARAVELLVPLLSARE
jgi:RNA-directed DNA polymerase